MIALNVIGIQAVNGVELVITPMTVYEPKIEVTAALPNVFTVETETEAVPLLEGSIVQEEELYRTLGGVRLKISVKDMQLNTKELASSPTYTWKINAEGRLCDDLTYKVDSSNCSDYTASTDIKIDHQRVAEEHTLYWEPAEWSNTLLDAQSELRIAFSEASELPDMVVAFRLKRRVLANTAPSAEVLKGTDVAMLESMLWYLGMSPNATAGKDGTRLTGEAIKQYSSVSAMVGRFNYSNFSYIDGNGKAVGLSNRHSKLNMDANSIDKLKQHWVHYKMAYDDPQPSGQSALNKAIEIFDGGDFTYPNTGTFHQHTGSWSFSPTYTDNVHSKLTEYKAFARSDIIKAMISKESNSQHWDGEKRITVGSADELGSKGFNQIQNAYTYGARSSLGNLKAGSRCWFVSAYTTGGESAINHYDPEINTIAMAAFLAGSRVIVVAAFISHLAMIL